MKNRLACIVLMLIVLACAVSFAETVNRDIPFEQLGLPYFSHLCAASDALYFYRGGDVWRYDEPTGACIPLAISGNEDFERLIYHQGDLYALTASGGLWLAKMDGDTMGLSPVAKFDFSDMEELVLDAFIQGDYVIMLAAPFGSPDVRSRSVHAYHIPTQTHKLLLTSDMLSGIADYMTGRLLALCFDENKYLAGFENQTQKVWVFDIATQAFTDKLYELPFLNAAALRYNPQEQSVYVCTPGGVYMGQPDGSLIQVAYLPFARFPQDVFALLQGDGRFVLYDDENVYIRLLNSEGVSTAPFKIANATFETYGANGLRAFKQKYPQTMITLSPDALTTAEDIYPDVLMASPYDVYATQDPELARLLIQKGYCADLSGSSLLMTHIDRMYPSVSALCAPEGKLFAVPYINNFSTLISAYNPQVMARLGLTEYDLPHTLMSLMDFIATYNDHPALDDNGLTLFRRYPGGNLRQALFAAILEQQAAYCHQSNLPLTLDTPLMGDLLGKLDEISPILSDMPVENPTGLFGDPASSLFMLNHQLLSGDNDPDGNAYIHWPFSLSEDIPAHYLMNPTLLIVSAASQNQSLGIALLEEIAIHMDAMSRISLYPDENEPVEMAYYGENLESHAQDMAHYDELIAATANEDEALRLTRLKQDQQAFWEATAHFRYEISPQSIAKYREIAGQLLPGVPTFGAFASRASGFAALLRGFSAGEISAAEFIAKGERVLRMVRLETDIP